MRGSFFYSWHVSIRPPVCGILVLCLLPSARLSAQDAFLDRFVASQHQRIDAEAELATLRSLNQELKRSLAQQPAPAPLPAVDEFHLVGVRETVWRTLESAGALRKANDDRSDVFARCIDLLGKEKAQALGQYRTAVRAAEEGKRERARIEWELGQPLDPPADWRRFLSPGTARALLLALGVGAVGAFAWRFEERLAWRRFTRRQGGCAGLLLTGAVAVLIIAIVTNACFLAWLAFWPTGEFLIRAPADAATERGKQIEEAIRQNQQRQARLSLDLQQARTEFTSLHEQSVQGWKQLLPIDKDNPLGEPANIEKETADQLRTLFHFAHAADRFARETAKLNDETKQDQQRLSIFAQETAANRRRQTLERGGIVAGPLAFFMLAIAGSRWRRWAGVRRESRQCPRCLQSNLALAPRAETSITLLPVLDLKCACGYAFPAQVNSLQRLYFPTYGHSASGKTTWLAMAYDQLNVTDAASIASMKSIRTEVCARFDDLARKVLVDKRSPDVTPASALPEPLLYHVVDRDAIASSRVLLNLFDFPGEITQFRNVARHDGSYRALLMHGFIFFLDPTGPIEPQFQALVAFQSALRELAGLDVNAPLAVPLAVCITKLDRLPETSLNQAALPWIALLRRSAKEPITLALIRRRSDLAARIVLDLFQGFDLTAELRKNFGASYLYFPQSNFGLEQAELDLPLEERGALIPFGTLEPIWWLLHMNGLQVLN